MPRLLAALFLVLGAGCAEEDSLPEILVVRGFTLTDSSGATFRSESLRGHVWVASFVFTSCPDVCPLITNQMANLHRRVRDPGVRFVSITVDPETDTPEILAGYRARYRADERWVFLTGEPAAVRRVVTEVFRLPMGERRGDTDTIAHSEHLLLVDREGVLRGRYETDRAGLDRLVSDIERLRAR